MMTLANNGEKYAVPLIVPRVKKKKIIKRNDK